MVPSTLWVYALALIPIAVFAFASVLSAKLSSNVNDVFPPSGLNSAAEAARRQFYLGGLLLFMVASAAVILLSAQALLRHTDPAVSFWGLLLTALVTLVALRLSGAFDYFGPAASAVYHSLDDSLFKKLFEELAKTKAPFDRGVFATFQFVANIFGAAASAIVITGCLSVVVQPLKEAQSISEAAFELRRFLFLGALTLTTGLLLQRAWMLWPSALLQDAKAFTELVDSIIAFNGVTFSLTLASFYFPAWLRLSRMADKVAGGELPAPVTRPKLQDWKRQIGLELAGPRSTLALLAPFLTGALGTIFSNVKDLMP
jgi:hypothetical protein